MSILAAAGVVVLGVVGFIGWRVVIALRKLADLVLTLDGDSFAKEATPVLLEQLEPGLGLGRSGEKDRVCSPEMTRPARREAPRS